MLQSIFTLALSFLLAVGANLLPSLSFFPQKMEKLIPPPQNIQYFTFGYSGPLADSIWLRWIQNLNSCGKNKINRSEFEKKTKSFKKHDKTLNLKLGYDRSKRDVCDKGWAYEMLRSVSDLAPRFRLVYSLGAHTLSVLAEDHEGARLIFDRGVEVFSKDWPILYRAAYHYLFELDDQSTAAGLLSLAAEQEGSPWWLKSLASRLYSKAGQLELGLMTLLEFRASLKGQEPEVTDPVDERIEMLKAKLLEAKKSKNQ